MIDVMAVMAPAPAMPASPAGNAPAEGEESAFPALLSREMDEPAETESEMPVEAGEDEPAAPAAAADPLATIQAYLALALGQPMAPGLAPDAAPAAAPETAVAGVTATPAMAPVAGAAVLAETASADEAVATLMPAVDAEMAAPVERGPVQPGAVIAADATAEAIGTLKTAPAEAAAPAAQAEAAATDEPAPAVQPAAETRPETVEARREPAKAADAQAIEDMALSEMPSAQQGTTGGQGGEQGSPQPQLANPAQLLSSLRPDAPGLAPASFQTLVDMARLPQGTPAEQVAVHFAQAAADRVEHLTVQLRPEALGNIEVRLNFAEDGRVSGHVMASRQDTLDLLQRDARGLERALADAGLQADAGSLSFSLRQGNQQSGWGDGQGGREAELDDEPEIAAAASAAAGRRMTLGLAAAAADGRLNITV